MNNGIKYPHLFAPLRLRGAYFRNRLFSAPQGNYNVGPDRLPGEESIAFYERKAIGGFASVCVGDCIIEASTGANLPWLINMEDKENLPRLNMLTHAVTRHGAVASAELAHDGMYSWASRDIFGSPLYGPVECENCYGHVVEMPEEMILRLIDKFGTAASFAKQCGFGMVTVHAGHGWLLAQFMSSIMNTRTDKWGGCFENRMRFPLAVIERIRRVVGNDFPIEVRYSGSEVVPEGFGLDEGIEIAKALDGKADILHISAGTHEIPRSWPVVHPSVFMEDGVNSHYAREIKKHVKQSLVATVGAFTDPNHMEEVLASGGADIINVARQSLADPDLPVKARTGREDEIARCIRCSKCFINSGTKRVARCSLNPEIGQELDVKMTPPATVQKKVLIAGGGIGGMEAAIQAAKRGHDVILCEKSGRLGGALVCEEMVPFKKHLAEYIKRQIRLLEIHNVEVRLNTEVTPDYALKQRVDIIVAALGAVPVVPKIPGVEKAYGAEQVYNNPSLAAGKIVILGAGLVGLELAIWLTQMGRAVDIIEMADRPGVDLDDYPMLGYRFILDDLGIKIHLSTKAVLIDGTGVHTECDSKASLFYADTVIYAVGQKPRAEEADGLAFCAPEFQAIGDCIRPDCILTATKAAYSMARDIGVV